MNLFYIKGYNWPSGNVPETTTKADGQEKGLQKLRAFLKNSGHLKVKKIVNLLPCLSSTNYNLMPMFGGICNPDV